MKIKEDSTLFIIFQFFSAWLPERELPQGIGEGYQIIPSFLPPSPLKLGPDRPAPTCPQSMFVIVLSFTVIHENLHRVINLDIIFHLWGWPHDNWM